MSQHTFEITGALLTTFLAGVVMPVSHEPNPHFMAIDLVVEREELEGRWRETLESVVRAYVVIAVRLEMETGCAARDAVSPGTHATSLRSQNAIQSLVAACFDEWEGGSVFTVPDECELNWKFDLMVMTHEIVELAFRLSALQDVSVFDTVCAIFGRRVPAEVSFD